MLKFSPKVRKVYPGHRPTIFGDIEKSNAEARKYLRAELKANEVSYVAKLPFKTWVLLQVGLRRALELTGSTVREINTHALVSSFVTTRALFETACVMFYTLKRVEIVLASPSSRNLKSLDDDVVQLLIGTRDKEWGGTTQAKNILTIIDHVAKVFRSARKYYNNLSEFAHPNAPGMLSMYERPVAKGTRAIFIDSWKENLSLLPTVMAGIAMSLTILNYVLERFHGCLPNFIRLCEEDIYRRGTWPSNIPYQWGAK